LRAWKQGSGGRTYFLYDGSEPVCEMNGTGSVTATDTFGANGLLSRHTSAGSLFYACDLSGNVAQRANASGASLSADQYDAFGVRQSTATSADVFGFGGKWGACTDAETGLVLMTHRYYDPIAARFLTRDPIGYAGGINLYAYTGNNPVNRADPGGTQAASSGSGSSGSEDEGDENSGGSSGSCPVDIGNDDDPGLQFATGLGGIVRGVVDLINDGVDALDPEPPVTFYHYSPTDPTTFEGGGLKPGSYGTNYGDFNGPQASSILTSGQSDFCYVCKVEFTPGENYPAVPIRDIGGRNPPIVEYQFTNGTPPGSITVTGPIEQPPGR